jgi:NAD(P)-dependent dehydrogenase (short-subunit alcohol dehydrogenase family)
LEAAYPSTRILTYQASVTDIHRMTEIFQQLGTVDVLVLSAAVFHRRAPLVEITTQEVQDAFDINVVATFNLVKAYLAMPASSLFSLMSCTRCLRKVQIGIWNLSQCFQLTIKTSRLSPSP